MYIEGFEGLEEAEKEPRRNFGSSSEVDRLLRENNKLKESLEKEKFFNKLLDQEIQELKTSLPNGSRSAQTSEYWSGNRKVSRGAFYTLLFVSLLMAAYIGYGIYYDQKFSYLKNFGRAAAPAVMPPTAEAATPANVDVNKQPVAAAASEGADNSAGQNNAAEPSASKPAAPVTDSVPTIIGNNSGTAEKKAAPVVEKKKAPARSTTDAADEYDEEEVNSVLNEKETKPAATASTTVKENVTPAPVQKKAVIGRYAVTSKANFYNAPDENTMRGTFISGSADKSVEALDEKNGFIYVEYTNDLGFTSKGWLSKKDLTKE